MDERLEDLDVEVTGMGLYSPEETRAMIQAAIDDENLDHPDTPIQLLELDELADYLSKHKEDGRTQLVIYKGNHYMAADILIKDGMKSCILLDAANDPRYLAVEDCFNEAGFETNTACGFSFSDKNLQTDAYSCPLFAFDHSVQFSHAPDDIHNMVRAESDEIHSFYWDVLPPNFLWNMQSLSLRDEYVETYPDEAEMPLHNQISFTTYIEQGLTIDSDGKSRNDAINVHVFNTVETVYLEQQREQILKQMDEKFSELAAGGKLNGEQISNLILLQDELSKSPDLSQAKNQEVMQRFDAIANPPKTTMFRRAMQYMRGTTPSSVQQAAPSAPDTESNRSKTNTSGKF